MAWLALAWRVAGYSPLVTRTAMLALAAFSLLGLFRMSRAAANTNVAWATTGLVAIYPVFFTQSSLAQVDLPAAGFTFWALLAYLEDRSVEAGALVLAGSSNKRDCNHRAAGALCVAIVVGHRASDRVAIAPNFHSAKSPHAHLPPAAAESCHWSAGSYHYSKTGHVFGSPEFFRYNVAATLNPLRIPLAFVLRLWQVCGYLGLYLLTLAGCAAHVWRRPQIENGTPRPRIAIWQQAAFAAVLLAYLLFMSAVGGAVLARYLLPVVPLVILAWVATLWRRAALLEAHRRSSSNRLRGGTLHQSALRLLSRRQSRLSRLHHPARRSQPIPASCAIRTFAC